MAGSLAHITADDGTFTMDLIDNLGDAHEALEECFNTINTLKARLEGLDNAYAEVINDHCNTIAALNARLAEAERVIEAWFSYTSMVNTRHVLAVHRAEQREKAEAMTTAYLRGAADGAPVVPDDQLRDAIIAAYVQGATDVHQNYQPDRSPDFTEAAHDYAASAMAPDSEGGSYDAE